MLQKPRILELAEMWVADYGDAAPARIREWARLLGQAQEIADVLEDVARTADKLLTESLRDKSSSTRRKLVFSSCSESCRDH